ncbi:hypothetical protein [Methylorubrum extorquens]
MNDQNTAALLNVEAKVEAFNRALLGEDELSAVVRGHIYIEKELIAFIKARLPVPEAIKDRDIDYKHAGEAGGRSRSLSKLRARPEFCRLTPQSVRSQRGGEDR